MAEEIYLDVERLEEEELTAKQLIAKMEETVNELHFLPFTADGGTESTGHVAEALRDFVAEAETTARDMKGIMYKLLGFIRNGALNITQMDAFLASETAGVGAPPALPPLPGTFEGRSGKF